MADTREIVITIYNKTDEDNSHDVDAGKGQAVDPAKPPKNKEEKRSNDARTVSNSVAIMLALAGAKQLIQNTVQVSLNRYYSMSENYIEQNEYRNIMTGVSKVTSLGGTVIGGITSGGVLLGPVGAVAGGLFAAGGWVANEAINAKATRSQYYSMINASNINTTYMRERAGLYMNGKGTEN